MAQRNQLLKNKEIDIFGKLVRYLGIDDDEEKIHILQSWIEFEKDIAREHGQRDGESSIIGQMRSLLKIEDEF